MPETAHASLWRQLGARVAARIGKAYVRRSYSSACSSAGARRVRDVGSPQFGQRGLSSAPKPRGFRDWFNMRGPPTRFRCRLSFVNVSRGGRGGRPSAVAARRTQGTKEQAPTEIGTLKVLNPKEE